MKRYLTIILLFNLIFGQYDNKSFDPNSLSKIQAQRLEEKLYTDFKEGLLLRRGAEMKARSIKINNREIKFDLKFFGDRSENGWELYFKFTVSLLIVSTITHRTQIAEGMLI